MEPEVEMIQGTFAEWEAWFAKKHPEYPSSRLMKRWMEEYPEITGSPAVLNLKQFAQVVTILLNKDAVAMGINETVELVDLE